MWNVSEDVGFVNFIVVRNGGSIGELLVNYSVLLIIVIKGSDYDLFGNGMWKYCCWFCLWWWKLWKVWIYMFVEIV